MVGCRLTEIRVVVADKEGRLGADSFGADDVGMLEVTDMKELVESDVESSGRGFEHGALRFRDAHDIREDQHLHVLEESVTFEEMAQ